MSAPERDQIARTETQSASLTRELRLPDLVLLQVLLIMGLPWIGYAAKLGGTHAVLWLAAIALFYFPLAGTVIYLSRRLPLEGGIYQWAKIGLSPFAGFQSAWNYSFFLILMYATSGSVVANSLSYVFGPTAAWMTSNKPLILGLNLLFFAIVLWINVRGLHMARWITSSGGAVVIALYGLIIGLLALRNLVLRPWRTAFLLLGYSLGVSVMIVWLMATGASLTGFTVRETVAEDVPDPSDTSKEKPSEPL